MADELNQAALDYHCYPQGGKLEATPTKIRGLPVATGTVHGEGLVIAAKLLPELLRYRTNQKTPQVSDEQVC